MLRGVLVAAVVVVLWLLCCGMASLDDTTIPDASALPPVSSGATVLPSSVDTGCGSGGCYRERVVEAGNQAAAARLVTELGLELERCRRDRSALTCG